MCRQVRLTLGCRDIFSNYTINMNKRECSDCRENEKTFRNNMHYKCVNEHCENYIASVKETKMKSNHFIVLNIFPF